MRIITLGDICLDVYTNLGVGFPGGGTVNVAVQAARLGASVGHAGVVGTDRIGDYLLSVLDSEGVDTRRMRRLPGTTAVAYVRLENGDRTFMGRNRGVRESYLVDEADYAYALDADLIHVTLDSRADAAVPRWVAAGKRVTFDFSHRATPEQLELLPHVELAFFSAQRVGNAAAEPLAREMHGRGARNVIVMMGEGGSLWFDGQKIHRQAAEDIRPVDTLGAGDAYIAGFLVSYLSDGDIPAAMAAGTRVATKACLHYGAFGRELKLTPEELRI